MLRHQLAVALREPPRVHSRLTWPDRAWLALLAGTLPVERSAAMRLIVTPARSCGGIATSSAAGGRGCPAENVPTGRSPRANAYAEHFVLTARTEVTDRMLIFGQRHLRTTPAQYEVHYNGRRPHRSRQLHPPRPDYPAADLSHERIQRRAVLGGLINEYERAA
jgi:putative transposase